MKKFIQKELQTECILGPSLPIQNRPDDINFSLFNNNYTNLSF